MAHSHRREAFWRFVAAFTYLPAAVITLAIFLVPVAIWWVIDILWQLTVGDQGLTTSTSGDIVVRFWDHLMGNMEWVILGRGEFRFTP